MIQEWKRDEWGTAGLITNHEAYVLHVKKKLYIPIRKNYIFLKHGRAVCGQTNFRPIRGAPEWECPSHLRVIAKGCDVNCYWPLKKKKDEPFGMSHPCSCVNRRGGSALTHSCQQKLPVTDSLEEEIPDTRSRQSTRSHPTFI